MHVQFVQRMVVPLEPCATECYEIWDGCRLQFCDRMTQLKHFRAQFQLAALTKLPMFLHLRAAADDFLEVIREQQSSMSTGVVHSFDGTAAELQSLLQFPNIYIGGQLLLCPPH